MPTGWKGSTRKSRLPQNWPSLRQFVLDRDDHRCQWVRHDTGRRCGQYANHADHIINNDDDRPANLQALCAYHHQLKSSAEGGRGLAAKRAAAKTEPQHPGIIVD